MLEEAPREIGRVSEFPLGIGMEPTMLARSPPVGLMGPPPAEENPLGVSKEDAAEFGAIRHWL